MIAQTQQNKKPLLTGFVDGIINYAKQITINDKIQISTYNFPKIKENIIQGYKIILQADLTTSLEVSNKLYYFTFKANKKITSIKILEFIKEDGKYRQLLMEGLNGEVVSAKAACIKQTPTERRQFLDQAKTQGMVVDFDQTRFRIYLLLGTKDGTFKSFSFNKDFEDGYELNNLKLDVFPLSSLQILDFQKFFRSKTCLVLSQSNKVYMVNFRTNTLISVYHPTIVACDVGLGLSVHHSGKYFIQYSEGGYIIFWTFSQNLQKLINKSEKFKKTGSKKDSIQKKFTISIDLDQENTQKTKDEQRIKPKDKQWNLFPFYLLHSASIQGLKWVEFFGDLVALITTKGVFKIVAPNFGILTKNQYCLILKHQIQDGQAISDVKFSPQDQQLIIVRSSHYHSRKDIKTGLQTISKSLNKKIQQNFSVHYRPKSFKDYRYDGKNMKTLQIRKPLIQRIKFNNQLQIEYLQKIRLKPYLDNIHELFLSSDKSIVIFKGSKQIIIAKNQIFRSSN